MKFLNGYKTLVGLGGTLVYVVARVLAVDVCHQTARDAFAGHGIDIGGGLSLALLALGLVHKAEKRSP